MMEDSTTHQEGFEKGMELGYLQGYLQQYRKLLLRQGTKRFGNPTPEFAAVLGQIADLNRLEQLADRMLYATGWNDLLRPE